MLFIDACSVLDFYIYDAIKDKRDGVKISTRLSILESFKKTCPEGMRGKGVYDGDTLEKWIRHNAIKILLAHRGELGPLEDVETGDIK